MSDESLRLTPLNLQNLVIAANVLEPGVVYSFQLNAMDPARSLIMGTAAMTVETNAPPSGGTCVPASYDTNSTTELGISCYDWMDDPSDFPLQYSFGVLTDQGFEVTVGFFQDASSMVALLPAGSEDVQYAQPLYVDIADNQGSTTRVTFSVAVFPVTVTVTTSSNGSIDVTPNITTVTAGLLTSMYTAAAAHDINGFVQSVTSITATLAYYRTVATDGTQQYCRLLTGQSIRDDSIGIIRYSTELDH